MKTNNDKDFSNVRYLKFSANDDWCAEFKDVVIDLVTNCFVDGVIIMRLEGKDEYVIDLANDTSSNLDCLNTFADGLEIFAKVCDTGKYYLLDENMNVIFKSENDYVPALMNYYNREEGYGDYIYLLVTNTNIGRLDNNGNPKINYNRDDDWEKVECNESQNTCDDCQNLYEKGMRDAFSIVRSIINENSNNMAVANILNVIRRFENKEDIMT